MLPTTDSTSTTEHPRAATEPHADPGLYLARDPNPEYTARGAPGAAPAAAAGTSAWSAWSKVSASPFFDRLGVFVLPETHPRILTL